MWAYVFMMSSNGPHKISWIPIYCLVFSWKIEVPMAVDGNQSFLVTVLLLKVDHQFPSLSTFNLEENRL